MNWEKCLSLISQGKQIGEKMKAFKICIVVSHSLFSEALFSLWQRKFGSGLHTLIM